MTDDKQKIAWRNLTVQWHLDQKLPLDCGCDDDTPDDRLCEPSQEYASRMLPPVRDNDLDGPPDKWDHDMWIAAWGRNAPMVLSGNDFDITIPKAPAGMSWLATRMLIRGRKVIELALVRLGENQMTTLGRGRVFADKDAVAEKARRMVQQLLQ